MAESQQPRSGTAKGWDAALYLKYGDERTRPAVDLTARIKLDAPALVVDLGCGPGNSTHILRSRWPSAEVIGIDNSADMIAAARKAYPDQTWEQADISGWGPQRAFNLVYSNAALQWIPDHAALMVQLFKTVAPGGALAFQIPSSTYATVRTLIHEISHNATWTDRMDGPRGKLTMESPSFYYDALCGVASSLDIWETEYAHVMESADAIVDWISSTGLRPFLAVLDPDSEREQFVAELRSRVRESYEPCSDGKVLFPFRRTFVVAYREHVPKET
jgi:trans-aconitate 2-methyltransferase